MTYFISVFHLYILQVTILEASDRVGGRILTYRDPNSKYYVDLGAMRIPYDQK